MLLDVILVCLRACMVLEEARVLLSRRLLWKCQKNLAAGLNHRLAGF
jgi:hypothetical protein